MNINKLGIMFIAIQTICIIILLTLLILPKELVENFSNIKVTIEGNK